MFGRPLAAVVAVPSTGDSVEGAGAVEGLGPLAPGTVVVGPVDAGVAGGGEEPPITAL